MKQCEQQQRVIHLAFDEIDLNALQNYLRSSQPPTIRSYKKFFYKLWYRKIRSRRKQKAKRFNRNNKYNIYAIAHRQNQEKNNNYWSNKIFITFGDLKRNEKLLFNGYNDNNNNNNNNNNNSSKRTITEYKCSRMKKISDNIYHTFNSNDKISSSIILEYFLFECPICISNKNINGSFIHDCGHLMCHDCVLSKVNCFPNTSLQNLFNKCHICRYQNDNVDGA